MLKLLLDEPPLIVLPSLAKAIGLNEAIVLQQLHYWIQQKRAKKQVANFKQGRWWVYNSYRVWRDEAFPFWSEVTIQRIFLGLEKRGLILSDYLAEEKDDRRKWYTIDYRVYQETVERLLPQTTTSDCDDAPYQLDVVDGINLIGSTASDCDPRPHQPEAVYRGAETPAETAAKTAAERGAQPHPKGLDLTGGSAAAEPDASLVLDLVEAGLNREDALRLAVSHPDECRQQLEYLPFKTDFKTSPGAYLKHAIPGGYAPPQGWKDAQEAARRRAAEDLERERREHEERERRERERTAGEEAARLQRAQEEASGLLRYATEWDTALEILERTINRPTMEVHLRRARLVALEMPEDAAETCVRAVLMACSTFSADHLQKRNREAVSEALEQTLGVPAGSVRLEIVVAGK